jgi:hypothetical protein
MIADRVLEVLDGGEYVSGARFVGSTSSAAAVVAVDRIGQLSLNALRHVQILDADLATLTRKLYSYNRLPFSTKRRQLRPTPEAVLDSLELGPSSRLRRRLEGTYELAQDSTWLRFRRRGGAQCESLAKLYISPRPSEYGVVAAPTIRLLATQGVQSFKLACTPEGVCRPDKFVAYFGQPSEATSVARELAGALRDDGLSAQPVPFTTPMTSDGLVSMGYLPPESAEVAAKQPLSWRAWICQRLAAAILIARSAPSPDCEPWQFALARLQFDGVDTRTWAPQ